MIVSDSFQNSTLPIGFTYLDLDKTTDVRIYCNTYDDNGIVKLNLSGWGNTLVYAAQSNWLDILSIKNPDFQWGSFSTKDINASVPIQQATKQVTFSEPFTTPPMVIVWLNELEISSASVTNSSSQSWRINASVSNITSDQFALTINTWADTYLYSAASSWIAYSANSTVFASGTFSTQSVRSWQDTQLHNEQTVAFSEPFKGIPHVTAALTELDFGTAANLRISLNVTNVTNSGLTWHLDSWDDSIFFTASGSYLAWYPTGDPTPSSITVGVSIGCSILAILVVVAVTLYRCRSCHNPRAGRRRFHKLRPAADQILDMSNIPRTVVDEALQHPFQLARRPLDNTTGRLHDQSVVQPVIHPVIQTCSNSDSTTTVTPHSTESRLGLLLDAVGVELSLLCQQRIGSNSTRPAKGELPPPYVVMN
jgi:hypothetical protein